MYKTEKDSM